jgi:pimeloyl-ACP methyl ester carboxylesterase
MYKLWILVVALSVVGCASQPHRLADDSREPCLLGKPIDRPDGGKVWEGNGSPCPRSWAVRYREAAASHGINYVEIDEQGMLRDRRAAEDALQFARPNGIGGKPVYVVVFIHGWHHDASAADGNVQEFHSALHPVSRWHQGKDVRGIYIGWRGKSLDIPLVRYATFWDRKSTSEEVGRGGLLEFLLRLERVVKPTPESRNRLVLVGHSFGASVAFNSLAHVFLERFVEGVHTTDMGGKAKFRGYGDLVVLINPAIEAMRYMPFQSALKYYTDRTEPPRADFSAETVPRLVVLSSEGDWATRKAFPVARFFSTVMEQHDNISPSQSPTPSPGPDAFDERKMDVRTLGNFERFHTHSKLRLGPVSSAAGGASKRPGRGDRQPLDRCTNLRETKIRDLLATSAADPPGTGGAFVDSNLQLERNGSAPKYMPYVLAEVSEDVIADHSDIGDPRLVCWISQLADGN